MYVEVFIKLLSNKFQIWNFTGGFFANFALQKVIKKIEPNEKYLFWGYTGGNLKVLKKYDIYNIQKADFKPLGTKALNAGFFTKPIWLKIYHCD